MMRRSILYCLSVCATLIACNRGGDDNKSTALAVSPTPQASSPPASTGGTAGGATAGGTTAAGATTGTPPANVKAVPWPALDFVNDPGGNGSTKTVALTFDDGPDGSGSAEGAAGKSNTSNVLDQLKTLGLKATFFVCSERITNLSTDASAQADLKRILSEGHTLGNHTRDHTSFAAPMTADAATKEFADVQATVSAVLGAAAPQMSLYRAPFGIPFQDVVADVPTYAPATAAYGVHVGWGIDSHDWNCLTGTEAVKQKCVIDNVNLFVKGGASGVILMHSIYKHSGDVLPTVVKMFKDAGYSFVMVEDYVKAKYGATSAQLQAANKAANFTTPMLQSAASAGTARSKWVLGVNEN